jgi:RHS repeat-associated protein
MIRESLADDAVHVFALVRGNRIRVYERTTTGGSTTELNGSNGGAPEWLRIVRTGNVFDLYHSNNGTSWTLMQSRTVTMGTNVYIGMAVTGNSTTTLATGTFNNVTVTGGGGGGPTATPTNTVTPSPTSPGPTATQSPTPSPTATSSGPTSTPTATATPPPNQPEVIVQRTTYTIAGQTVFLRLRTLEDGVEVSSDLYALHSDHLGSTSTLSYIDPTAGTAYRVLDSRAFYTPFGDYRLPPTGDYTDRGYTGHLGNNSGSNDIGLIYMNARFYVPGIGRFASADTIVPSPERPQSFNRYSYVNNRPLNSIDPTGHQDDCGFFEVSCHVDNLKKNVLEDLQNTARDCYNEGDAGCVEGVYFQLGYGGYLAGNGTASRMMINFLTL